MRSRPVATTRRRSASPARLLLVVVAGVTLLVACGSGSDTATATTTPGSAIAASAIAASTVPASIAAGAVASPTTGAGVAAAVGPVTLLDKQAATVLGQALAYPTAVPAQVSSVIVTLLPGQETGLHRHDAPMYAYILEGAVTVEYQGGVTKVYPAGSALMEAVGTTHNGRNLGSIPVRILTVNIGAEGVANTVRLP